MGTVSILNVGAGDIQLSFNGSDPAEKIRAARIVKDMLRRGYALLVEVERNGEKKFERALDFDETHFTYIIADLDAGKEQADGEKQDEVSPDRDAKTVRGGRGRPRKAIEASKTRAVGVGRSAGG